MCGYERFGDQWCGDTVTAWYAGGENTNESAD